VFHHLEEVGMDRRSNSVSQFPMSASIYLFSLCPTSMPPTSTEPAGRVIMWMLAALLLLGESVMRGHQQDLGRGRV
jgi:hypothetical protein